MSTGSLPGFRDFYPEQFAQRAWLFERWRDVARRFGFVEYDGPPLEPLELYTKKSGDEIVGQLYNFEDKGGRQISLRPEMTPTVARMVAARANALRKPVRWFSIPQLFRYERQQKGRLREHFQLNVDIFGESDVAADAELLAVAIEVFRSVGLTHRDVKLRVSDRRLLNAILADRGFAEPELPVVYAVLDKIERVPYEASIEKLEKAGIERGRAESLVLFAKESISSGSLESVFGALRSEEGARFLKDLMRSIELASRLSGKDSSDWIQFDLSIVRGLAYYTGMVFEAFDAQGEFRAVCGGGRYDNLLKSVGDVDMPGLGFGMGDVVLTDLLLARGKKMGGVHRINFWIAAEESVPLDDVFTVAAQLRNAGAVVGYGFKPRQLGKQFRDAEQSWRASGDDPNRSRILILRDGWREAGEVLQVKSLIDGSQFATTLSSVVEWSQGTYPQPDPDPFRGLNTRSTGANDRP